MSDVTTELAMEASDKAVQIARLKAENDRLWELVKGWQKYAADNTFGDIYKSEDVVDSYVVTFCDKHGYRLYTSMEVYGLLHDPNASERILTHDELPETIPCSDVFADIDV